MEIKNFTKLLGKNVRVNCSDGETYPGRWEDVLRADENEPYGETILLKTSQGLVEISTSEIESIREADG